MHTWQGEVRDYELDAQGRVNNARYLHYLEHARHRLLEQYGISFVRAHQEGTDFILAHIDLHYKASLYSGESFTVQTQLFKQGRLRLMCEQTIYKQDESLVCQAMGTIVCLDSQTQKPFFPAWLDTFLQDTTVGTDGR